MGSDSQLPPSSSLAGWTAQRCTPPITREMLQVLTLTAVAAASGSYDLKQATGVNAGDCSTNAGEGVFLEWPWLSDHRVSQHTLGSCDWFAEFDHCCQINDVHLESVERRAPRCDLRSALPRR